MVNKVCIYCGKEEVVWDKSGFYCKSCDKYQMDFFGNKIRDEMGLERTRKSIEKRNSGKRPRTR